MGSSTNSAVTHTIERWKKMLYFHRLTGVWFSLIAIERAEGPFGARRANGEVRSDGEARIAYALRAVAV
jgi:hypothetical protein